jgi:hypothetical protein
VSSELAADKAEERDGRRAAIMMSYARVNLGDWASIRKEKKRTDAYAESSRIDLAATLVIDTLLLLDL